MNRPAGIVVCGGLSSRMGGDKSLLTYHDIPQRYHIAALLQTLCSEVYLSLNAVQAISAAGSPYPFFTDLPQYSAIGPLAAILTAFHHLPGKDLLVIGCDYPLLDKETLEGFIRFIRQGIPAAFYNADAALYEPLLAYYPAAILPLLEETFAKGYYSLQQCLQKAEAARYLPPDPAVLFSADDPAAMQQAREWIRQRKNDTEQP